MSEHENYMLLSTPFPPTLNHNIGRNGKRYYRDKNYDNFIEIVGYLWKVNRPREWRTNGYFRVVISLYPASLRRFDADNRIKPTLDALTHAGAWEDDSQVVGVSVRKMPVPVTDSCAIIEIIRLEEMEALMVSMKRLWSMATRKPMIFKKVRTPKAPTKTRSRRKR